MYTLPLHTAKRPPALGWSLVAALGFLAIVLAGCSSEDTSQTSARDRPRAESTLPVRAYVVERRTLERRVQIAASVEAMRSIQLAARTDGVVSEVAVEAGDRVKAGQLLARIDVSEQRAELARAQAALREARANFERLDSLRARDFVDAASLLTARSTLDVARSEVELWQTRLDFGRIEASIDGYVIARMIEPGAAIGRLQPAFELADLDQLVLRVGVSELDVGSIEVGSEVAVSVDALGAEAKLSGRVRRVLPAADSASRLVSVEIELPSAYARGVRPGYLARADLQVEQKRDVLAVPAGAVGMGSSQYVMVINDEDSLVRRAVTTGIVRGSWREITDGLQPGDRIVSTSPLELAEGERVRVVDIVDNGA